MPARMAQSVLPLGYRLHDRGIVVHYISFLHSPFLFRFIYSFILSFSLSLSRQLPLPTLTPCRKVLLKKPTPPQLVKLTAF